MTSSPTRGSLESSKAQGSQENDRSMGADTESPRGHVPGSGISQTTRHASVPRVRFSQDVPRTTDAPPSRDEPLPEAAASSQNAEVPKPLLLGRPAQNRNRGYSLRRALFTQNIERKDEGSTSVEMEPSASSSRQSLKSDAHGRSGKAGTTVTVTETEQEEDQLPSRPVRFSGPGGKLPVYQRWLAKDAPTGAALRNLQHMWNTVADKIMRAQAIPSTVDGRHVRVNALKTYNVIDERTNKPHIGNTIRSCRYTPYNFVPRQLAAQFGKVANFYFLCVSTMQMIPGLSTTGTYTTIVPLLIFVGISMAKEGYDDVRRNRLDKEENEREVMILDQSSALAGDQEQPKSSEAGYPHTRFTVWRTEKWQDVRVGDVVLLERDAPVPADVILLHANNETQTAYIETKSLDGETNLKLKKPLVEISDLCSDLDAIASLSAEFVVEDPNLDLYKFDGRAAVAGKNLPLTNNEVIYRSSTLRNTSSAVGIVIYSGEECKIRMNANKNPRVKAPSLQAVVNRVVIFVAALVFFIAILLTVLYQVWRKTTERKSWYLVAARVPFHQILTSFIIMFNTMLPLSLYVSLEIVKVSQMFLMNDIDMYDPDSDTPMKPQTSTINEELGQVSYIFSDKTGTLTNNSMKFRKLSVAGSAWLHDVDLQDEAANSAGIPRLRHKKRGGKGKEPASFGKAKSVIKTASRKSTTSLVQSPEAIRTSLQDFQWQPSARPANSLHCGKTEELLEYLLRKPNSMFAHKAKFFILGLALCHTCMPEKDDEGNISYQAASPDELALVTAAQDLGYIVTDRQTNTITVKTYPAGEDEEPLYEVYEVLDVIEFSSGRKRMSIIIRFPDQRICMFTKGADTILRKRLRLNDLAAFSSSNIERRASERKSLEAQEVLRRRSIQGQQTIAGRNSISAATSTIAPPRNSSISISRNRSARESIDHWLKERENDVDLSVPRKSNTFYTPRTSNHYGVPRKSGNMGGRPSLGIITDARSSFQTEDYDDVIDENIVLSDAATFEHCFQHVDDFATEGLRTLLYGYRTISEEEYAEWKSIYSAASTSLVERQEKMEAAGEIIENNLELLGATAIEDKLQDGVPDAIDRFRRAGIKMWMLTGDKRETAINIGHSCRLIKDYSTTIILDHEQQDLDESMWNATAKITNTNTAHSVLVVDGQTLGVIDNDPNLKNMFTEVAIAADSVICCRASPSQKASLVRTIRTRVKGSVTLAIGDGANDIAMIQEAHLGIGIAGKEGLQAARTSDYSIAQFRFLLKLLLVHGRWNYIRICKYTLGTFWKEMLFYLVQAMYQRWTGYTGTSLYEPWSLSMFNTLFTSLPVIFMGVFEKDLAASTLLAVPELYSLGQRNQGFNFKVYAWWASLGAFESAIVFFTLYGIYGEALFTRDNRLFALGSLAFTACVTLISLKLQFIELHNKSIMAGIAIFLSVGGWWLWSIALSTFYADNTIYEVKGGILTRFGRNPLWWLTLILIVLSICLLEVTIKAVRATIWPTDVDTFQAYERDIDVRKRFEEAAADLLQQGWNRGVKKSSLDMAREAQEQFEREQQVQRLLDRPRTMMSNGQPDSGSDPNNGSRGVGASVTIGGTGFGKITTTPDIEVQDQVRRRHSGPTEDGEIAMRLGKVDEGRRDDEDHEDDDRADGDENVAYSPTSSGKLPKTSSVDIGDLFSRGFGSVRKSLDLR